MFLNENSDKFVEFKYLKLGSDNFLVNTSGVSMVIPGAPYSVVTQFFVSNKIKLSFLSIVSLTYVNPNKRLEIKIPETRIPVKTMMAFFDFFAPFLL